MLLCASCSSLSCVRVLSRSILWITLWFNVKLSRRWQPWRFSMNWTPPHPTHTHTGISSSSSSIDCGTNSISVFWPWSVCLRLMTTDWGIVSEPQTDSQSASAAAPLSCTWYLTGEYWLLIIDYWLLHVVLKLCVHISSCTSSVILRVCSSSCLLLLLHLRTRKLDRLRMDERQTGSDLL